MKKVFNGVNFGMEKYLRETKMLDYSSKNIQRLIQERNWNDIEVFERLKSIYNFVRDEILFGYNIDDNISASKVLADGYGQCNTKGTLFMALLRACNIPCRVHGFTIDKKLQKGAMTGIVYKNAPQNVFHSWVEVNFEDKWYELEAFILDMEYLRKLQRKNSHCTGAFCGYGVAVKDFKNPIIDFDRNNTYIQSEGVYRMIVNVRVDHRLLHGQVAMAWNQVLGSDCILIANDSVPNDEIRKAGIKLAKPANTKLVIKNMDASVEALVSGVTDKYKLFIVVESIADVYKLCKETGMIDKITLGGVKSREGTRQISKAVFTTPKEEELLKELITDGVTVEIRQVPSDSVIYAKDVL